MNKWTIIPLRDVVKIVKKNYTAKCNWDIINYLDTGNITQNKIENIIKFTLDDKLPSRAKRIVEKNDVIYSTVRPNQKHFGILKNILDNMLVSTGFAILRAKKQHAINDYIYYYLSQEEVTNTLHSIAEQSTSAYPSIRPDDILNLNIPLPPLPTQRRIAGILSALDDKIENNRRICETLEQIAQTIFKRWFVDFDFPDEQGRPYKSSGGRMIESELGLIPKNWVVGILSDLVSNIKAPCDSTHNNRLPYLPIDVIPKSRLGIEIYDSWENAKSSLIKFKEDDIIIGAMRVYFHRVVLAPFTGITRTTCMILRPKNKSDRLFSLFHINQDSFIEWASNNSKGSTMPYTFWNNGIEKYKIVIPPVILKEKFERLIAPLVQIIKTNYIRNISLQKTRDTLLPKLMSGEVEV